ncbi:MAG: uncharacterized protein JWP68_1616 [Modestobacter sp.]|nr:uncharacterized protein [Modestobacter sp.]
MSGPGAAPVRSPGGRGGPPRPGADSMPAVILLAAFLLVVAVGLLAGGLAQGSATLQWGSFAASALAVLVLAVGELRRRRAAAADDARSLPARAAAEPEVGALGSTPAGSPDSAPPVAPASVPPAAPVSGGTATAPPSIAPRPAPETAVQPAPEPVERIVAEPVRPVSGHRAGAAGPTTGADAVAPVLGPDGEPPVEEVEVTDLLLVLDLTDEVLVVDEHPRYHLAGCPHLDGVDTLPLPMDEARTDGFTPCRTCAPDRNLAERERARRA